jgi:hypothetical protein
MLIQTMLKEKRYVDAKQSLCLSAVPVQQVETRVEKEEQSMQMQMERKEQRKECQTEPGSLK